MKILLPSPYSHWFMIMRCTGKGNAHESRACKAVLEVDEEDIFSVAIRSIFGELRFFTITCPNCGAMTDIPKEDIPQYVRSRIIFRMDEIKGK